MSYGGKGSDEMKKRMAELRAMRGKGGGKKVSKKDFDTARSDMKKIMSSKTGAIKEGKVKASGKKAVAKEVDKEVPSTYILIVNNKTKKSKRMPRKAFSGALVKSDLPKSTKESMLRKAQGKDREIFTANKKALEIFKLN
tara:strand:+ start:608 stop:1027 length:420 start_codon:yes stop_codon:yes gene_type:complete